MVLRFRKDGSTKDAVPLPFVTALANSVLGILYGFMVEDWFYLAISVLQLLFASVFLFQFHQFAVDRPAVLRQALPTVGGLILLSVVIIVLEAVQFCSHFCCLVQILNSAAPLSVLQSVIERRDASSMSFSLAMWGFIGSGTWIIYGGLTSSPVIWIPMTISFILSCGQLYLIRRFGSGKVKVDDDDRDVEMAFTPRSSRHWGSLGRSPRLR
mmetsp:Transcript_53736/g.116877  ORF Transcript_53736/g.116877 Transcript_53736/m.116877 type:complete len:212 (+) Transcript_53736:132-767(+)